jgi:hypothetical protein
MDTAVGVTAATVTVVGVTAVSFADSAVGCVAGSTDGDIVPREGASWVFCARGRVVIATLGGDVVASVSSVGAGWQPAKAIKPRRNNKVKEETFIILTTNIPTRIVLVTV